MDGMTIGKVNIDGWMGDRNNKYRWMGVEYQI